MNAQDVMTQIWYKECKFTEHAKSFNKFSLNRRPVSILKTVKLVSDLMVIKHFDYYFKQQSIRKIIALQEVLKHLVWSDNLYFH
jgi:hypothetical protein